MPVDIPVPTLERVVRLASRAVDALGATVSLGDGPRVHYDRKSGIDVTPDPDDVSLCESIALSDGPTVIENVRENEQFSKHPFVREPSDINCVFGIPLRTTTPGGTKTSTRSVGALYVGTSSMDAFSSDDAETLEDLAYLLDTQLRPPERPGDSLALLEQLPAPVVLLDPNGGSSSMPTIDFVNEALTSLAGYARQELIDQPLSILSGPKTDATALQALYPTTSAAAPFTANLVNYTSNGEKRFLEWNLAPIPEAVGTSRQWIAVVHDETKHVQMKEEVRERERKVEALYKETGELYQAETPQEVAAHIEDLVLDTLGYPLNAIRFVENDELIPVRISQAIPPHMPQRPTYSIEEESVVARAFRNRETLTFEDVRTVDDGYDRGDARATAYVPLSNHGMISIASLEPDDVQPFDIRLLEILASNAAVTLDRIERDAQQRRTIDRLDALRKMSRSILSASSAEAVAEAALEELANLVPYDQASVVACDASTETISLLAVDHVEGLSDDITDRLRLQHFQTEDGSLLRETRLVAPIPEKTSDPVEEDLRAQGLQAYLNVPLGAEEEVIGFLNLGTSDPGAYRETDVDTAEEVADMIAIAVQQAQDRQQLLEAKNEAERMNRLKTAFLANMSHEIRTPLTSIIGFADLLTDYDLGEANRFTSLIERSGRQLLETIDSVLGLSKLEAGSVKPTFERIDVCEEITEVVELAMPQAEATDVTVHTEVPDDSIETKLDRSAFRRILQNLLGNAIKFTNPGGTVTVRARREDDTVVLQVEDTGIGIDEDFVPHLFEAFEQESVSDPDEHSGTGLGLAVTKRLVDLLDGSIEVESTKGEGTCFTVRLPHT